MYCDYFGFKQEPFTIAPDPAFLYPSSPHRQALAHLKYGLDREGGFILLTGEVGTGKTTLTRLLLEQIPAVFRVAYVLNAKLDILDVLASICDELNISLEAHITKSPKTYIDAINANLLDAHSQGFKTLVVIEEAQNLDEEVLEMLRLLTNLETNTCKLLHILLVGQPELLELIGRPQLRQLNQRVISRFHLDPLDRPETEKYLLHRIQKAGCSRKIFSSSAIRALYKLSEGVPRKLNLLAERALLGTYSLNNGFVTRAQVVAANKEVFGLRVPKTTPSQRLARITLGLFILLVCTLLGITIIQYRPAEEVTPAPMTLEQSAPGRTIPEQIVFEEVILEEILVPVSPVTLVQLAPDLPTAPEPISSDDILIPLDESASSQQSTIGALVLDESQTSDSTGRDDPFGQILELWGVQRKADSSESLCMVAVAEGLRCAAIDNASAWYFRSVNRPQLVRLNPGLNPEVLDEQYYVLTGIVGDMYQLERMGMRYSLFASELQAFLAGPSLYLWKPPLGYIDSIRVGDSNRALMNWLQPRLVEIDSEIGGLITGGRYSQPISDVVAEFQRRYSLSDDGILGRLTLMKFNEAEQDVPTLGYGEN